jgi:hypothetical protein
MVAHRFQLAKHPRPTRLVTRRLGERRTARQGPRRSPLLTRSASGPLLAHAVADSHCRPRTNHSCSATPPATAQHESRHAQEHCRDSKQAQPQVRSPSCQSSSGHEHQEDGDEACHGDSTRHITVPTRFHHASTEIRVRRPYPERALHIPSSRRRAALRVSDGEPTSLRHSSRTLASRSTSQCPVPVQRPRPFLTTRRAKIPHRRRRNVGATTVDAGRCRRPQGRARAA